MSARNVYSIISLLALLSIAAEKIAAKDYLVKNKQEYKKALNRLAPGDTVILRNGIWKDFEILLYGKGSKDAPITLSAETKGEVILTGQSNLKLAGEYLIASGLVFKNGYTPSSAVIEFRRNKTNLAFHSRVTEIVIDNYNKPDRQDSDNWVVLYGKHNRFDHSHLVGKRNKGVTLAVRLNDIMNQSNYHTIDHNYFGYRPTFGSNGGETLRIGTSTYSLTDSHTLVEKNFFEKTNGEVEIISIKSGKNIFRGNVFYEARGTLTMRHGNNNIIEENIFIGNDVDHTGGIRIINKNQLVRNNYLENLSGFRFGSGLTVMNGVPNSRINRYHQVENARITNNTFINVDHIHLAAGSDTERSAVPINSVITNNLIINEAEKQPFSIFDDISGIRFSGNVMNGTAPKDLAYGVEQRRVSLKRQSNGLLYPEPNESEVGVKRGLDVLSKSDTGVDWYPKTSQFIEFDSGKNHAVSVRKDGLRKAISKAKSGDVLELAPGTHHARAPLMIDKILSIKASKRGKTTLTFEKNTLFDIQNGGSLKLDGLVISGKNGDATERKSVIRTQKGGMLNNFRVVMRDSEVHDMDASPSFSFLVINKNAFADEIRLTNNVFRHVSGDILSLNAETEDLGIYNAEYVTLVNNQFIHIKGSVVNLYRGGTDESTFGPHLSIRDNRFTSVGRGKLDKGKASIYAHGVQLTEIADNTFTHSAPIVVKHTVGEPKTSITGNTFRDTGLPNVSEMQVDGPHTALVEKNKIEKTKAM